MAEFNKTFDGFNKSFEKHFGWLHTNQYVVTVLILFLTSYVALARPRIPHYMENLFHNGMFRFVVLAYILYCSNKDVQSSILLAFGFLYIMHIVNKQKIENMAHFIETTVDSHYCQNPNNKKTAQCQLILDSNNNDGVNHVMGYDK